MPISAGYIEGKPVTVLRDTRCSGIVVRKSMVSEDRIIRNNIQTFILADGSTIKVPVATVFVDTPYISGTFEAWCMTNPVYDLIIGNVDKDHLMIKIRSGLKRMLWKLASKLRTNRNLIQNCRFRTS